MSAEHTSGSIPDAELMARVTSRDTSALRQIFEWYAGSAFRTALRILQSSEDAEDAVQNIFMNLPKTAIKFEGRGSIEGFIRRIAAREALSMLRLRRGFAAATETAPLPQSINVGELEMRIDLDVALRRLPVPLRVVFVLKDVEGLTTKEISSLLEIPVRTVTRQLHLARRKLRTILGPDASAAKDLLKKTESSYPAVSPMPSKGMKLELTLPSYVDTDEVSTGIVQLIRAINAYHIQRGGSGFVFQDLDHLVRSDVYVTA